jgi:hypothetical protein
MLDVGHAIYFFKFMNTYLHVHFMNIVKFDTSFSFCNLLILQIGQMEHATTFRTGNTSMHYNLRVE